MRWCASNADMLNVEGSRLGMGGISAGAGLAVSLALLARDSHYQAIKKGLF